MYNAPCFTPQNFVLLLFLTSWDNLWYPGEIGNSGYVIFFFMAGVGGKRGALWSTVCEDGESKN